jgi:hypothetical protein
MLHCLHPCLLPFSPLQPTPTPPPLLPPLTSPHPHPLQAFLTAGRYPAAAAALLLLSPGAGGGGGGGGMGGFGGKGGLTEGEFMAAAERVWRYGAGWAGAVLAVEVRVEALYKAL